MLNKLEKMVAIHAHSIITGTSHMVDQLQYLNKKVFRAPTAVDPEVFKFNAEAREKIRSELNIRDREVFIYLGKLGGLYYEEDVIHLLKAVQKIMPNSFFLIATNYDHNKLEEWFSRQNISKKDYVIRPFIPIEEVPSFLSAADMGICAIPPKPSQRFRSPTKVAEYLLCGLPFITCYGISEDDYWARKYNVGLALTRFDEASVLEERQVL
ncbi:glycosyltransferase, partial [Fulvivirga aurantia]|uniref:glycosyltransferase n=1 Tax=Fulvivirga aurantia TaxID=2529383 RepID=UPI001628B088